MLFAQTHGLTAFAGSRRIVDCPAGARVSARVEHPTSLGKPARIPRRHGRRARRAQDCGRDSHAGAIWTRALRTKVSPSTEPCVNEEVTLSEMDARAGAAKCTAEDKCRRIDVFGSEVLCRLKHQSALPYGGNLHSVFHSL
jgi:hypothetical protein